MSNDRKYVVLVADDEPSTVALLGRHLRGRGYTVLEANDGDQAWQLAHEHLPHLVILDVMMPGMSGWEVCRKIREAVSLAHTGVIMLTGIGEALNEMTSPLYGADAHVDKPFEFADLDRKITQTLERRQAGALGRPDAAATDEIRLEVRAPESESEPEGSVKKLPLPRPIGAKKAAPPAAKAKPPVKAKPAAKAPKAEPAKAKAPKAKPPVKAKAKPPVKAKAKPPVKAKAKPPVKAKAKAKVKPIAKAKLAKKPAVAKAARKAAPKAKAKPAKAPAAKPAPKAKAGSAKPAAAKPAAKPAKKGTKKPGPKKR